LRSRISRAEVIPLLLLPIDKLVAAIAALVF
jgi:hypothetical protein